ncbi:MAG: hypothetical protein WB696_10460 [Chthoniobacterales bacterium]|jgi:hypothetical protein
MISDAEIQHLAELYAASAEALDPLAPDMEQRRRAFDMEVERLYSKYSPQGITLGQFRSKAVQMCVKHLRRDLPPDERRARDTSI